MVRFGPHEPLAVGSNPTAAAVLYSIKNII